MIFGKIEVVKYIIKLENQKDKKDMAISYLIWHYKKQKNLALIEYEQIAMIIIFHQKRLY